MICTNNFSVKFYRWSLTDEQILRLLRDLQGYDYRENETKSDNNSYEDYVSLGRKESSIWTIWSFAKVEAQEADKASCNPIENFYTNVFLSESFY